MVAYTEEEKAAYLNKLYQEYSLTVTDIQSELRKRVGALTLPDEDKEDVEEYLEDRVNLFRFAKGARFDVDVAVKRIMEVIEWRIEKRIGRLSWKDCPDFFKEGMCFFHKHDKLNEPILFVRLRLFPTKFEGSKKGLVEHIAPYAALMMEMGRRLTWDITRERAENGDPCPLVSQIAVVTNISNAPLIPIDASTIKEMSKLLEKRYGGVVTRINVLNFGWMYQSLWTFVKLLLNERAKRSIQFTTVKKLESLIDPHSVLIEMGGYDDYVWSIDTDLVLQKYGSGKIAKSDTPSSEDDDFYDAIDSFPDMTSISPNLLTKTVPDMTISTPPSDTLIPSTTVPATPRSTHSPQSNLLPPTSLLSPVTHLPPATTTVPMTIHPTVHDTNQPKSLVASPMAGLRTGVQFLTSFVPKRNVRKTRPLSTIYWILIYILLRGPIESNIRKMLIKYSTLSTQRMTSTAIGMTALISAIIASSVKNFI
ncbi:CRAL-TRIO domain-containing protein [Pilobolus umbonatus]|nr:CRAL-TRIO domain-containing protein [Pilobolus umbonatus]